MTICRQAGNGFIMVDLFKHKVKVLHSIVEATGLSQISNQRKLELASELRTLTQHFVGFPFGPSRASDAEPATEQFVDDVCTDEAGCACNQDVLSVNKLISVAKRFKYRYETYIFQLLPMGQAVPGGSKTTRCEL